MSHATSIAVDTPLVASPNQAMRAIQVSRKKLYELINTGELESYTEGKSHRITIRMISPERAEFIAWEGRAGRLSSGRSTRRARSCRRSRPQRPATARQ